MFKAVSIQNPKITLGRTSGVSSFIPSMLVNGFLMGHSRPLFLNFRLFNEVFNTFDSKEIMSMTRFELRISGVQSNHSTN